MAGVMRMILIVLVYQNNMWYVVYKFVLDMLMVFVNGCIFIATLNES